MRQLILKTSNIIKVQLFLFGVASSLALPALGQAHLEPAKDRSKYSGNLKEYYDHVFERLLKRMSDKPLARYLVLTSFSPEYVLSLEEIDTSNYILKYGTFNKNFPYPPKKPKTRHARTHPHRTDRSECRPYPDESPGMRGATIITT
jgi:hypothetical protein